MRQRYVWLMGVFCALNKRGSAKGFARSGAHIKHTFNLKRSSS